MPKKSKPKPEPNIVTVHADHVPALTPGDIARYNALPDGTPDEESPERTGAYRARLRRIESWKVQRQGRPAAGAAGNESIIVSLRMPVTLRAAVTKRAKKLHVTFNAAMQEAAAAWVSSDS